MLSVQPQNFDLPRDQISMDSAPSLQESQFRENPVKQQKKKSFFSIYKILLALSVFFIAVFGSYMIYNSYMSNASLQKSQINSAQGKFIQTADSSSTDKGSSTGQSGSTSSKSSKNNDKPNHTSQPASKSRITSNIGGSGSFSGGSNNGDDEDEDNDKNSGDKNSKFLKGASKSVTKTRSKTANSKGWGSSTEEDSDSVVSEDDQNFIEENDIKWPDAKRTEGVAPLLGSTRP